MIYEKMFIKELNYFRCETGINPNNCIVNNDLYNKIVHEQIQNMYEQAGGMIRIVDELNLCCESLNFCGVNIHRGNGKDLFYFYKTIDI